MRDYSLIGPDAERAVAAGLAAADWYHSDIPRKEMKALMAREDGPAIRDTLILYGAMVLFAGLGIWLWPSWWSAPFWLAYGVLYGSASDSRWHECGHGTAFRTAWMNNAVYHIASFMIVRNPVTWRWSHARHHTDTIIVGRDPEIAVMRPPAALRLLSNFFGLADAWAGWNRMILNASGRQDPEEATFIPESERQKVVTVARVWVVIYAATIGLAVWTGSILPLMVIGLPRLYGAWHHVMTGLLQHGALADNVIDHRLNSRTVYMNPVSRFIYWNMNYHIEHHMFPMVPYHRLPDLHERIKDDLPAPTRSIWAGYREMLPVLMRQLRGQDLFLKRALPATARPYREELHMAAGQPAE
ncbi:fatty acid desaturase family protein [Frigidibacter sp. RF13]|uniref:fatty acid desaturase family protein n=1 Tax=Frigidibacter sp. RF13 TaxID=2997340 RepID=UPI002270A36F|nr:fatty acid desaturase family protein [Frigidibacter sp. RF13]MCY1127922.1 fatty acid desaturase family protein [Frigidibacter sp. RF13]